MNLQLKPESRTLQSIHKFCEDFFHQTGNRIILIERYDQNQEQVIEEYRSALEPIPDLNLKIHIKYEINYRDKVSIIVNSKAFNSDKTLAILQEHFWDSTGKRFNALKVSESSSEAVKNWQVKTRQHKAYSRPQKSSIGSPIEDLFEKALKKAGVVYRKQVKVHIEGEIFTIPDFVIDDPKIAIYCDGSEFHSATQRIMKDKQQDRILQSKGYIVLRFSGSEIFHNAGKCVRELLAFFSKSLDKRIQP